MTRNRESATILQHAERMKIANIEMVFNKIRFERRKSSTDEKNELQSYFQNFWYIQSHIWGYPNLLSTYRITTTIKFSE